MLVKGGVLKEKMEILWKFWKKYTKKYLNNIYVKWYTEIVAWWCL